MTVDEVLHEISRKLIEEEDLKDYSDIDYLKQQLFEKSNPNLLKHTGSVNIVRELIDKSDYFYEDAITDSYILDNIEKYKTALNSLNTVIYFQEQPYEEKLNFLSTDPSLKEKVAFYNNINEFLKILANE